MDEEITETPSNGTEETVDLGGKLVNLEDLKAAMDNSVSNESSTVSSVDLGNVFYALADKSNGDFVSLPTINDPFMASIFDYDEGLFFIDAEVHHTNDMVGSTYHILMPFKLEKNSGDSFHASQALYINDINQMITVSALINHKWVLGAMTDWQVGFYTNNTSYTVDSFNFLYKGPLV